GLTGSGERLSVAFISDFTAGTVGSAVEQFITGGKANAGVATSGIITCQKFLAVRRRMEGTEP
ncbi:MAG: hypothetical protein K2O16_14355, partial [Lachnospiraceae bacterium]|nr:hypothetical protein [Lachnospiraceae bacterium]